MNESFLYLRSLEKDRLSNKNPVFERAAPRSGLLRGRQERFLPILLKNNHIAKKCLHANTTPVDFFDRRPVSNPFGCLP